ncbi:MAG TPA: hypothetical protein PLP17_10115, partial [Oligoflexia bacterium]|nr:hypothetical protein [Oligoflexia bacterium]
SGDTKDELKTFVLLFGDVLLKRDDDDGGGGGGGGQQQAGQADHYFHYAYQMPHAVPQRIVALYKNRCYHTPGGDVKPDLKEYGDCDLDDEKRFDIKKGICPSLMEILNSWTDIMGGGGSGGGGGVQDLERLWMEATIGHPLSGRDIKELLAINGDKSASLKSGKEKELAARVIETWCEASAVAATARLMSLLKARAIDHVTLSRVLTNEEKGMFMQLVNRYIDYLSLAQMDVNSKMQATAMLTGASILYDRLNVMHVGGTSVANQNAAGGTLTNDKVTIFGNKWAQPGTTGAAPAAPQQRTMSLGKTIDDFRSIFGSEAADKLKQAEVSAARNDPINKMAQRMFGK